MPLQGHTGRSVVIAHHSGRDQPQQQLARSDKITLTGVGCVGYHGVLEAEKQTGQPFFVDATLYCDLRRAAAEDQLAATVDYAAVAECIRDLVTGQSYDLIETLAERIAASILDSFPVQALEITVHKPKAPIEVTFSDVSVTIFREKTCL